MQILVHEPVAAFLALAAAALAGLPAAARIDRLPSKAAELKV